MTRWRLAAAAFLTGLMIPSIAMSAPQPSGIEDRFQRAEQVFHSADQPSAIALFTELLAELDALPSREAVLSVWTRAMSYRAQARFNVGDADGARADLERLLAAAPDASFDANQLSPKFIEVVDELRKRLIGRLEIRRDPADAVVRVDGRRVENASPALMIAAGRHVIEATRLGYTPHREDVEVAGGEGKTVDVILTRSSAVVRFSTRPADIRVRVDGRDAGIVTAAPGGLGEMVLDGLAPGDHRIDLEKDGYRTHAATLRVETLADYTLGMITMERTAASIVMRGLTPGQAVDVDGSPVALVPAVDQGGAPLLGAGMLQVAPGGHRIFVDGGARGVFSADVSVVDQQRLVLDAKLRPGLAFMGVLGGDTAAASRLTTALRSAIGDQDVWAWLDRSRDAAPVLRRASLERAAAWRAASAETAGAGADLGAMQSSLREAIPASLYVLAVLSDDLVATHADLWIWPASPGPAAVDRLAVDLQRATLPVAALAASGALRRGWFGALLVDVETAAGPVVFDVTPDSPAAAAGLQPGDEIVPADGTTGEGLRQRLSRGVPGDNVALQVRRAAAVTNVAVVLGETPVVQQPGPDRPGAVLWAGLERPATGLPLWVIELNRAAVLLDAGRWEEAVRLLRGLEIQQTQGVGQGTRDFWLGMALASLGPEYAELARAALTRAVQNTTARLEHNDGPLIWPLAQALLERLRR